MRIRTARDLGALVRERRRTVGLTQEDLAKKVGASRRWVAALEGGKSSVELNLVLRTLTVLDLVTEIRDEPAGGRDAVDLDAMLADLDRR